MAKNTPVPVDQPMRLARFTSSLMASLKKVRPTLLLLGFVGLSLAPDANAQITVQNLDQGTPNDDSFRVGTDSWLAVSFTTDDYASSYQLGSITILSDGLVGTPSGYTLRLFSDSSNAPGSSLETLSGNSNPDTSDAQYTYSSSGTALSADTRYWVVASSSSASGTDPYFWAATDTTDQTTTGGATWSIGDDFQKSTDSGANWSVVNTGGTAVLQFSVSTAAVPEPSTYAAILGACALGFVCYRRYRCKRAA